MKKIAVISVILEEPRLCQNSFNEVVSSYGGMIRGRMGIPLENERIAVVCLAVIGTLDEINSLTGKLGNIEHVLVKTSISKKEVEA